MNRLIVIVGPTAAGKSGIALQLAKRFDCEIVSGDSMCIYRGMDIGTAKPTADERKEVPHHLVDILGPEESFSVADFQKLAERAIDDICRRGKIPLLVGGTGFYVQALLEGYQFSRTPKTELRRELQAASEETFSTQELYQSLFELDPETAGRIHPNDLRRVLRALEVIRLEQLPISRRKRTDNPALLYDCIVFGLSRNRQELYRRVDARVDSMLSSGLVEEVEKLLAAGLSAEDTAMQAIGYKEIVCHLSGEISIEDAVSRIKQSSRRFAKRQATWFRRMPYIHWIDMDGGSEVEDPLSNMSRQVAEKFSIG